MGDHHQRQLLLIARYPEAGRAKTRLIPALGEEGASRLHRRLTERAVATARTLREARGGDGLGITVCYTGASRGAFRAWLGSDLHYAAQPRGDLGARLLRAFESTLRERGGAVVAAGADVPGLSPELLDRAFEQLRGSDVVLGPAVDGGYYLIGMRALHPGLFAAIEWGTGHVREQTRAAARRLGLDLSELPPLPDVDRPEDLDAMRGDPLLAGVSAGKTPLSVVIPTLDEEEMLGRALEHLQPAEEVEILVVDGGSRDATRAIAARAGATVLEVAGGRAAQQNAGAAAARGRHLLFLHADTLVPEGYDDLIRSALEDPATVAGAFRFRIDDARWGRHPIEWVTHVRSSALQMPYGDQGLFLEKRVFEEMGGFPLQQIMEDFELVRRLRRRGTIVTLPEAAVSSARRYRRLGLVRTTAINQVMIAGYLGGVPLESLRRFYRRGGFWKSS